MVKILKYSNPDNKIKLKIRQIQVLGKSTGQINNTGYEELRSLDTKHYLVIRGLSSLVEPYHNTD